jgi:flagellar M-ring protein FliF
MDVISQFFKELGPTRIVVSFISIFIFCVFVVLYLTRISHQEMVVLYSDLSLDDSNRIVQELDAKNIQYELLAGGTVIKVSSDKVLRLRMSMAEEGIPSKGSIVGYELFDAGESISTSSFMQNVNLLRALEGELSRTISTFDNVLKARVHLVVAKRDLFSRDQQAPRASIILTMKGHNVLKKSEINAVAHLIATAVPDLDINRITIVDTKGRPLKLGAKDINNEFSGVNEFEEYRVNYEMRLKHMIEDMLEKTLGEGKVKSYVAAEINFDRVVTNSETFDPDGRVARSIQTIEEKDKNESGESGDSSIANNLPGELGGASGEKSSASSQKTDETTNFEISKTVKNHISETGTVKRVSVSVLVDGVYKYDKDTKKVNYTPRTDDEIQKYTALVKSAIGFRDERSDKVEVINMPFLTDFDALKEEDSLDWIKEEFPNIIQTVIMGLVIVLILVLVVRPIALRAFEVSKNDVEVIQNKDHLSVIADSMRQKEMERDALNSLQDAISEKEEAFVDVKSNPKVKKLNEIIERNLNASVTLLRKWMNEEM